MRSLITHHGRMTGYSWPPTDIAGELARRIDIILTGGVQTEAHREMAEYRRTLPFPHDEARAKHEKLMQLDRSLP
jgi:hypothetical protein